MGNENKMGTRTKAEQIAKARAAAARVMQPEMQQLQKQKQPQQDRNRLLKLQDRLRWQVSAGLNLLQRQCLRWEPGLWQDQQ